MHRSIRIYPPGPAAAAAGRRRPGRVKFERIRSIAIDIDHAIYIYL